MRKIQKASAVAAIAALMILCAACPAKDAAVAVNRYATSLSSFQDAEIVAFNSGAVSPSDHGKILNAEKAASKAGRDLNTAIKVTTAGGDPSQYVDAALKGYDDLVVAVKTTNNQNLITLGNAAGALLKNAISLIQTLKMQKAVK